jgi:hypothetical protein
MAMIRAPLRICRRITCAAILLGLLVCGAEVGVRVVEISQGRSICPACDQSLVVDPTRLSVPSWLIDRELKPHAAAEVKCRDQRRTIEIRTNSKGLRSFEAMVPKPPDVYRIVVLGDETILSPEVSDNDHFVQLLSQRLQSQSGMRIEVINAAFPGACPLTEYVLFKEKLLALNPDLVLMHFDWSDVADDRQLRRQTRSDADGLPLSCPHISLITRAKKPNPLDTIRQQFRLVDVGLNLAGQQWKQRIAEGSATSRDLGANAYAWLRNEHPESDVHVMHSFRPITELALLARASRFQLVVMTSPKPWQVSARCTSGAGIRMKCGVPKDACYSNRAAFDALANHSGSVNLPYFDMSNALMDGVAESNFLKYAPRWSPEGHRRVAEFLARNLTEQIPGPWNSRYFQQPPPEESVSRQPQPDSGIRWAGGRQ